MITYNENIDESYRHVHSDGDRFLQFIRNRNFFDARIEMQRLFRETALRGHIPTRPLWGIVENIESRYLRGTIGILLEFIGQRTMRYTTIGAILHLDRLLSQEIELNRPILTDKERLRAKRLLMVYTLRHPRDIIGTPYALDTIYEHFSLKYLYRSTLQTYKKSHLFAPSIRERISRKKLN